MRFAAAGWCPSLDQFAIETAVPVMTEQDLERMREANRDFERAVAANDITAARRKGRLTGISPGRAP
ncbi:hypothetical protein ACFYO2_15415 [Streptomyces sp. NPDC006602]|uniref:hypothetical protein n=1 Tax=Streptomyces sp. NPDC006602 TaxID=3364751 RepID=UPI0036B89614